MTTKLNENSYAFAQDLVKNGKVVLDQMSSISRLRARRTTSSIPTAGMRTRTGTSISRTQPSGCATWWMRRSA